MGYKNPQALEFLQSNQTQYNFLDTGPGAIGNRTIGTAAAGGMLIGTIFGLMIIPGLYYIFGSIAEKSRLARYENEYPLTEQTEPYKHDGKFEDEK